MVCMVRNEVPREIVASMIDCLQFEYHCDIVQSGIHDDGNSTVILATRKEAKNASEETKDTVIKSMMSIVHEDSVSSWDISNDVFLSDDNFIIQTFQDISDHELSVHLATFRHSKKIYTISEM